MGCDVLLRRIFLSQGSNPGLLTADRLFTTKPPGKALIHHWPTVGIFFFSCAFMFFDDHNIFLIPFSRQDISINLEGAWIRQNKTSFPEMYTSQSLKPKNVHLIWPRACCRCDYIKEFGRAAHIIHMCPGDGEALLQKRGKRSESGLDLIKRGEDRVLGVCGPGSNKWRSLYKVKKARISFKNLQKEPAL